MFQLLPHPSTVILILPCTSVTNETVEQSYNQGMNGGKMSLMNGGKMSLPSDAGIL